LKLTKMLKLWCGWRKDWFGNMWRLKKAIDGNLGCQNINLGASDC
jgi:hypothetical protein